MLGLALGVRALLHCASMLTVITLVPLQSLHALLRRIPTAIACRCLGLVTCSRTLGRLQPHLGEASSPRDSLTRGLLLPLGDQPELRRDGRPLQPAPVEVHARMPVRA